MKATLNLDSEIAQRADRLRTARLGAGHTSATKAAASLNVPLGTYSGHENGHRRFFNDTGRLYASAFGVSFHWLMFNEGQADDNTGKSLADYVREGRENMNEKNFIATHADVDDAVAGALAAGRDLKMVELTEAAQEVIDLLHALDKIGDGIGGADGFAVSAVAIAARSVADNVYQYIKVMGRDHE